MADRCRGTSYRIDARVESRPTEMVLASPTRIDTRSSSTGSLPRAPRYAKRFSLFHRHQADRPGLRTVPPVTTSSDVPDVLAADLDVVLVGINPGRASAAAHAHFANPRNDFWRLLHAAGLTPRLLDPAEQFDLLKHGIGVTNAAYRTTPGSGDLRRADFA